MRILIEVPTWLGDCVMATPAIDNILYFYNDAELTLIGSSNSIEVIQFHPKVVNRFVLSKKYIELYRTSRALGKFDIFFSFRGSLRSNILRLLISSKKSYQFNKSKYSYGHQVEKYNQFVEESLGFKQKARKLNISNSGLKYKSEFPLLGINPGASYGSAKCWPHERFIEVATTLSKKFHILIFGGINEVGLSEKIEQGLKENNCRNFTNLTGKTTIKELIGFISSLDLFITGDSGPMHIAAAFEIPTVSIFGPTKVHETCQWMNTKSSIVMKDLPCQPCMKRVCPYKHHHCMNKISAKEVVDSALNLI